MTIQELRDQQEQAKQDGVETSCIPYPECIERVQQAQNQATISGDTGEGDTGNAAAQQLITQPREESTPQLVEGVENNILVIGGLIVFVVVILLLGILIALNRIAKKN